MSFLLKLESMIQKNNSLVCLGLDSDIDKLPKHLTNENSPLLTFNMQIIDATHDVVSSYKFQIAYYSALGIPGVEQLIQSISYLRENYPEVPVILDAKRGDVGNTSEQYAKEAFAVFKADAITVNPYLGHDGLEPFFRHEDKGVFILCRTSNPGAKDFQDLQIAGEQLYMKVAEKIVEWNKIYGNCLMVVGATYPEEMKVIRQIAPDIFFLVPGIGAQGGDLKKTMAMGLRKDGSGLLIHSARSIIYASNGTDFSDKAREEAIKLRDKINAQRQRN